MAKKALSRSKVELFMNCPRCFWLDQVARVQRPAGFPFNLNSAVDHLLKNEFDRYRGGSVVPPRLAQQGLSYIPARHEDLPKWRHNFTGVRVEHAATGLTFFGAIDDLWVDRHGEHYVVDYKATSKNDDVSLDAAWQIGYKRQVEFYQWLLRARGLAVSDTAWFVYANGIRGDGPFDDLLHFRTSLLPYQGSDAWVEPTLVDIAQCLALPGAPAAANDCEYCAYVARAADIRP
ncbi:MAG TPA: PD-(D/E)XK nuclease family protein [Steroidobacteraceae bacterium]|nr:PD-(D/E)XK nuclease family protein [Steroidobacteraceae bacterium]